MAPRPHNSGHHTIEACQTSQYENHLRAICDLPLGLPNNINPSVLINLLGSAFQLGNVKYSGIDEILKIPGSNLHIYGKKKTKPFRKMGHVNILFDKDSDPIKYVNQVKHSFKTSSNK